MSKDVRTSIRGFKKWLKWLIGGVVLVVFLIPLAGFTGAQLENNDAFCASCHTEPESTYVDRAHAGAAVDLAGFHAVKGDPAKDTRCIDCHSGEGVNGRVHAVALGVYDTLKFVSGNYPQPSLQTHPIGDKNCVKCHAGYADNQDFKNHFHTLIPKWQEIDSNAATCVSCHQSHTENGDPNTSFLDEPTTVAVCQDCHLLATEPDSPYSQLPIKNGAVDLAGAHAVKSVQCNDCHSGQGMMFDQPTLWQFAQGNYAQPVSQTHFVGDENCLECHADVADQQDFNNHFHTLLSRWQETDSNAATCISCHQSHTKNGDPNTSFLDEQTTAAVCQDCHHIVAGSDSPFPQLMLKGEAVVDLAGAHTSKDVLCSDCHSGQEMMFDESSLWQFAQGNSAQSASQTHLVGDDECLKCHADIADQQSFNNHFHILLPKWQAIDSNAATCVSCHQSHAKDGDPGISFLNEQTTVAVCQSCHRIAGE